MRFRPVRALAVLLACVYFCTHCAFAAWTDATVWTERRKSIEPAPNESLLSSRSLPCPSPFQDALSVLRPAPTGAGPATGLVPPASAQPIAGKVAALLRELPDGVAARRVAWPDGRISDRIVVHIEDVHGDAEAQSRIGEAVSDLIARPEGAPLIALEGGHGPMDLARFRALPFPDTRRRVADFLLRENLISGPVHAGLLSPAAVAEFVGVDDPALHEANVAAYRASRARVARARRVLASLRWQRAERPARLNPALARFHAEMEAYRAGRTGIRDYVGALADRDAVLPAEVERLRAALAAETSLNAPRIARQRDALLSALLPRLNGPESSRLVEAGLAYRLNRWDAARFYGELEALSRAHALSWSAYPALTQYRRYLAALTALDPEAVLREARAAEDRVYARLARTAAERRAVDADRVLGLLSKLIEFSLTKSEWRDYASRSTLAREITGLDLGPFEDFYRDAEARDAAMAENLSRAMSSTGARVAVLVTGGFHAEGIDERLRRAGATTITVVPSLSKVATPNGSLYLSAFMRQKTPLEKLVEGDKLFLARDPALGLAAFPPLAAADRARAELADAHAVALDLSTINEKIQTVFERLRAAGQRASPFRVLGATGGPVPGTSSFRVTLALTRNGIERTIYLVVDFAGGRIVSVDAASPNGARWRSKLARLKPLARIYARAILRFAPQGAVPVLEAPLMAALPRAGRAYHAFVVGLHDNATLEEVIVRRLGTEIIGLAEGATISAHRFFNEAFPGQRLNTGASNGSYDAQRANGSGVQSVADETAWAREMSDRHGELRQYRRIQSWSNLGLAAAVVSAVFVMGTLGRIADGPALTAFNLVSPRLFTEYRLFVALAAEGALLFLMGYLFRTLLLPEVNEQDTAWNAELRHRRFADAGERLRIVKNGNGKSNGGEDLTFWRFAVIRIPKVFRRMERRIVRFLRDGEKRAPKENGNGDLSLWGFLSIKVPELFRLTRRVTRGLSWRNPLVLLAGGWTVAMLSCTGIEVRINQAMGGFLDSMIKNNPVNFAYELVVFYVANRVIRKLTTWQSWMISSLKQRYRQSLQSYVQYELAKDDRAAKLAASDSEFARGADQRIDQDASAVGDLAVDLVVVFVQNISLAVNFGIVLWGHPHGGLLLLINFGLALFESFRINQMGNPLGQITRVRSGRRGDYRDAVKKLVADGGSAIDSVDREFGRYLGWDRRYFIYYAQIDGERAQFGRWVNLFPYIFVAGILYLSRPVLAIGVADIPLIAAAFVNVNNAFRFFIDKAQDLQSVTGALDRVVPFVDHLVSLDGGAAVKTPSNGAMGNGAGASPAAGSNGDDSSHVGTNGPSWTDISYMGFPFLSVPHAFLFGPEAAPTRSTVFASGALALTVLVGAVRGFGPVEGSIAWCAMGAVALFAVGVRFQNAMAAAPAGAMIAGVPGALLWPGRPTPRPVDAAEDDARRLGGSIADAVAALRAGREADARLDVLSALRALVPRENPSAEELFDPGWRNARRLRERRRAATIAAALAAGFVERANEWRFDSRSGALGESLRRVVRANAGAFDGRAADRAKDLRLEVLDARLLAAMPADRFDAWLAALVGGGSEAGHVALIIDGLDGSPTSGPSALARERERRIAARIRGADHIAILQRGDYVRADGRGRALVVQNVERDLPAPFLDVAGTAVLACRPGLHVDFAGARTPLFSPRRLWVVFVDEALRSIDARPMRWGESETLESLVAFLRQA